MQLTEHDPEKVNSKRALFHPHVLKGYKPKLFFRDDGLSDLIGFEYSKMNSLDAANDMLGHLVNIADFLGHRGYPEVKIGKIDQDQKVGANRHVISVILDGENAWEYYPHNGFYFLDHLYQALAENPLIKTTTFSDLTENIKTHELETLCAGSWVHGSFSTWIGEPDKNLAWDRLIEAKQAYDTVLQDGKLKVKEIEIATRQLAICEGSDWFWWFGDNNSAQSVSNFDQLFRTQLKKLYNL